MLKLELEGRYITLFRHLLCIFFFFFFFFNLKFLAKNENCQIGNKLCGFGVFKVCVLVNSNVLFIKPHT